MAIAKKPGSARRKRTIPTRDALDVAEPTSGLVAAATPSNLVELDPGLIADAGLKDRHTEDPEIEALAESIRTHGQQVPVIVHFKEGSGYSLIAGRRRRLACLLDQRVVLARVVPVADLDEAHALQIIENKDRRDISFSEHLLTFLALAPEQREALWSRAGFDRQWRSHMRKILETVPAEALRWIGADEKLGRQKLRQLADLAERAGPKKTQDTFSEARKAVPNSTSPAQRLAAYAARLKPEPATRPKCTGAVLKRGARTAELKNGLVVRLTDEVILVESPDGRRTTTEDFNSLVDFLESAKP